MLLSHQHLNNGIKVSISVMEIFYLVSPMRLVFKH